MFGIIARNRGMWGCMETLCKRDGVPMTFPLKEQAEEEAERLNNANNGINNFNSYYVVEIGKEN